MRQAPATELLHQTINQQYDFARAVLRHAKELRELAHRTDDGAVREELRRLSGELIDLSDQVVAHASQTRESLVVTNGY